MKYLSLFSGIGGFELGIQQAYENIGYSEIDKYAIQIYEKHFPEHKNYGDITKIDADNLPDFDFLCGGFPCQSFSIAGKRKGFEDTRGTLFFDIARILKAKRPRLLLLENVKGLLSHDNGNTFKIIISTLDELGYDLQWQVLNSKNHGVPQNRERVFIVGHLRGTPRPKVFPFGESGGLSDTGNGQGTTKSGISPAITSNYKRGVHSGGEAYVTKEVAETLQYKGLCDKLGVYASTQEENAIKILQELQAEIGTEAFTEWGLGILDSLQPKEVLQSVLHGDSVRPEASQTESTMDDSSLSRKKDMPESELLLLWESKNRCSPQEPRLERQFIAELSKGLSQLPQSDTSWSIRRLTPKEAERLQGFPDGWTALGYEKINCGEKNCKYDYNLVEISDTQRYKCLGNAVTVNVVREIMKKLITKLR